MDNTDNTDPTDPLRTLENDDADDLFKSAFKGTAGVIKITSDSDCEPGQTVLDILYSFSPVCVDSREHKLTDLVIREV